MRTSSLFVYLLLLSGLFLSNCDKKEEVKPPPLPPDTSENNNDDNNNPPPPPPPLAFKLESGAFKEGATIPSKYTCTGQDKSPPLSWTNAPSGTKSFVLICEDPDAPSGTFDHWIIYDIPSSVNSLKEGILKNGDVAGGMKQGRNSFGDIGYDGPCPPAGPAHRYYFKLYALNTEISLSPGVVKGQVMQEMSGHILKEASLMGKFGQ